MKKLAIIFPGRKYSEDCPLLYYSDDFLKSKGFEIKYLHYGKTRDNEEKTKVIEDIEKNKEYVIEELEKIDFSIYDKILFVSKSIGTVLAGYGNEELEIKNVAHIFLTPLPETLTYIQKENCIVIAGGKDPFIDENLLMDFCEDNEIYYTILEGLNHSLETDDVFNNIDIIKTVLKKIEAFIEII